MTNQKHKRHALLVIKIDKGLFALIGLGRPCVP
jgi:hypothetical protein